MSNPALNLILHNIRSAHNVGAIFRTADGAGVDKIYLTGYTPAPVDQFKRPNGEIKKTALGAEETVAWEKQEDISELITELKKSGVQIWALEQAEPEILNLCDQVIEIPMRGIKESLNVAVATGIALFHLTP